MYLCILVFKILFLCGEEVRISGPCLMHPFWASSSAKHIDKELKVLPSCAKTQAWQIRALFCEEPQVPGEDEIAGLAAV